MAAKKKSKKSLYIAIVCVILVLVLFLVAGALRKGKPNEGPNNNQSTETNRPRR